MHTYGPWRLGYGPEMESLYRLIMAIMLAAKNVAYTLDH